MTPPEAMIKVITFLSKVTPKAKLVPQKDLAELAFRELKKRKMVCSFIHVPYMDAYQYML